MKRNIILITLSWILPACAAAQARPDFHTSDDSTTVCPATSLRACLEKGLRNNYSLRIVRNEEQMAANNATRANAGYLPTVNLSAGYGGSIENRDTKTQGTPAVTSHDRNVIDHNLSAGINAEWTIFDGFKIQTNYKRLQELKKQSATQTRIAIEDYMADLVSEYYNFVQQRIRMRNLRYAVALSRERLRIVQERYIIGSNSRLDLQQAQVDFNADSAQSLKQRELLASSRIRLNELMAEKTPYHRIMVRDSAIEVDDALAFDSLWQSTLRNNAQLIRAAQDKTLAELDLNSIRSRDYPYVRLNAGYGYSRNMYGTGTTAHRQTYGPDFGVTVGFKIFDGNRRREQRNARIAIENAELAQRDVELALHADLSDLWQAYRNNLRLLALERQNLVTAQENHFIARERYLLGDLSGIEMREAQKSLLDAEERILVAEYNTKLCEISLRQLSGGIMKYLD